MLQQNLLCALCTLCIMNKPPSYISKANLFCLGNHNHHHPHHQDLWRHPNMRCVKAHERQIEEKRFRGVVTPDHFSRFFAGRKKLFWSWWSWYYYFNGHDITITIMMIMILFPLWLSLKSPVHVRSKPLVILKTHRFIPEMLPVLIIVKVITITTCEGHTPPSLCGIWNLNTWSSATCNDWLLYEIIS